MSVGESLDWDELTEEEQAAFDDAAWLAELDDAIVDYVDDVVVGEGSG